MGKRRIRQSQQTQHHTASILSQASNTVIQGGTFTNVVNNNKEKTYDDEFKLLQKHVATTAFHNSKQRADPPRCHENTRQAVLQRIFSWISEGDSRTAWIAWLNGAAGAGKSAICQSTAEMCIAHAILVASFFFFRTDPSRNTIDHVAATLSYQLIQLSPSTKDIICGALEANPLIFEQSFETQLEVLVILPLRQLQASDSSIKLFLIVDGVDECDGHSDQLNIIRTFSKFAAMDNSPIIILFGSRAENQLQAAFRSRITSNILLRLPLDYEYHSSEDIYTFLLDKFIDIKETHPFGHLLSNSWPAPEHVREIAHKSSGQFIYASVAIKFISTPNSNPSKQLDIVRGLHPVGLASPFSQLDALYMHILSTVVDPQTFTILAYILIAQEVRVAAISKWFGLTDNDVMITLSSLVSILTCERREDLGNRFYVRFLHASFPDFLLDRTRSGAYHINPATWGNRMSLMWFDKASLLRSDIYSKFLNGEIPRFLETAEVTPDLVEQIRAFNPATVGDPYKDFYSRYLSAVRDLDLGDGGDAYRQQLELITRYLHKRRKTYDKSVYPSEFMSLEATHNVSRIVAELEKDEESSVILKGQEIECL